MEHKVYKITKEKCNESIGNRVCASCGGQLSPLETIDNGGNHTFWSHCPECMVCDNGVPERVHLIAKEMVLNNYYVAYSHIGSMPPVSSENYDSWCQSQIRGAADDVMLVLRLDRIIADGIAGHIKPEAA